MQFEKLYSKDKNGKVKEWSIEVTENESKFGVITVRFGYDKIQENVQIIEKGKNKGKKNETTPLQQAIKEAQSKFNKKIKEGCVASLEDTLNFKQYKPMLCHDYLKRAKDIIYPCFVQPKLDGVRALVYIENDKVFIKTRGGNFYPDFEELKEYILLNISKNVILDGELYTDKMDFETLVGLCKKNDKSPEDLLQLKMIKFHIFDIYEKNEPELDFENRKLALDHFKKNTNSNYIEFVETKLVENETEMKTYLDTFLKQGYEGIILRNKKGLYKFNHRNKDLQKYKLFTDSEFKIVNFKEGTGIKKGLIIWICEYTSSDGTIKTFTVDLNSSNETRRELFKLASEDSSKFIGKMVTVKYQNLTKNGCPRFPKAISIRDYE